MTVKEKVVHAVQDLPDDASIEDAMERLFFLSKVEKGIYQANSDQTLSHVQVKERMAKMAETRWTQQAAHDLEAITEFIANDSEH